MKRIIAGALLPLMLATLPSQAASIVNAVGTAAAFAGANDALSIVIERDFSGTYATGTWITPDAVIALYFDCVSVLPGAAPGTGEVTASSAINAGTSLPLLRGITVRIHVTATGTTMGVADGVRGTGSSCGKDLVPMRAALAGAVSFVAA